LLNRLNLKESKSFPGNYEVLVFEWTKEEKACNRGVRRIDFKGSTNVCVGLIHGHTRNRSGFTRNSGEL
jgi:hypothetical protein